MTSFLRRNLNQTISYWAPSTVDAAGDITFSAPVEIKGRWEERTELFVTQNGEERRSRGVVYLDRDIVIDGFLMLGSTTASSLDPRDETSAFRILDFRKVPNLKATDYERRAII